MGSRPMSLKWSLFLALVAAAMLSAVEAQPAVTNAWKPIIFSTPAGNEISSNPISPSTQPLPPAAFRGLFQNASPIASFNDFGPPPNPGGRILRSSQDHGDWIFKTPAELMGVASEQLLQRGERNGNDPQKNLTPMERYLERQNSSARFNPSGDLSRSRDFLGRGDGQTNSDTSPLVLMDRDPDGQQSPAISSQFLNTAPGNDVSANQDQDSVWSKLLGNPSPQSTPSAATLAKQQAELNQFQQMLNPGSVPVTAATTVPDSTTVFKPQNVFPISDSTQPLVNPIGASFAPLNTGIGEPAALTPLPAITRQASVPAVTAPTWAPQPAPWLSQNPQPFAIPQRKF